MEFFKIRRTIPFMRHALIFNVISLITFIAAVFFLVHRGLNYSIEFTGGTLIEVGYHDAAKVDAIRQALEKAGYKAEAQSPAFRPFEVVGQRPMEVAADVITFLDRSM